MSLTQAQQTLISRANRGHDGHRRRRIAGAAKELRRYLERIGVEDKHQVHLIVRDAIDMANLERACVED